mmetsp:Transcript_11019/g.24055  ORF Transcript_11019/g.24055 Transcript_11019/m.24055 type:complete len:243 (+) Transcript_11019:1044-1772(+)
MRDCSCATRWSACSTNGRSTICCNTASSGSILLSKTPHGRTRPRSTSSLRRPSRHCYVTASCSTARRRASRRPASRAPSARDVARLLRRAASVLLLMKQTRFTVARRAQPGGGGQPTSSSAKSQTFAAVDGFVRLCDWRKAPSSSSSHRSASSKEDWVSREWSCLRSKVRWRAHHLIVSIAIGTSRACPLRPSARCCHYCHLADSAVVAAVLAASGGVLRHTSTGTSARRTRMLFSWCRRNQ